MVTIVAESAAARDANAAAAVEAARLLSIEAAEGAAARLLRGEVEVLRGVNDQLQRLQARCISRSGLQQNVYAACVQQ
jgi:hypothetical protein